MCRKILALILCLLMFAFVGCKSSETTSSTGGTSSVDIPAVKPVEKVYYVNNLTGEATLEKEETTKNRPVAIMVNNLNIAQKVQTGLTEADIVYETEVEGGITRLMAVFKDISKVEKIGTIRSARYPYIDLSMGHDAIYIHHGQDPNYARPHLRDTQTLAISKNNAGVRIKNEGLASEHTLYGLGDKIWEWLNKKNYKTTIENNDNWQKFADKETKIIYTDAANTVRVPFSKQYVSVFKFDSASGKYVRYFGDTERKDYYTGENEKFKNVFVLETSISYYPDGKHKRVDLSKGNGYYCVNGTYTPIKWAKGSASSSLKFTTLDGTPLEVNQGNSWVCFHGKSFDPSFE